MLEGRAGLTAPPVNQENSLPLFRRPELALTSEHFVFFFDFKMSPCCREIGATFCRPELALTSGSFC